MSTRDELADELEGDLCRDECYSGATADAPFSPARAADFLIAEGWRKKPEVSEAARTLYIADNWGLHDPGKDWDDGRVHSDRVEQYFRKADAILALMDRGQ